MGANSLYKRGRPKKFQEEGMPPPADIPTTPEAKKVNDLPTDIPISTYHFQHRNLGAIMRSRSPFPLSDSIAIHPCQSLIFTQPIFLITSIVHNQLLFLTGSTVVSAILFNELVLSRLVIPALISGECGLSD